MENTEKNSRIKELVKSLCVEIDSFDNPDEKIDSLNYVRSLLHEVSPLKHHPVDCVQWVRSDDVEANEYNPNAIPPPEMELLYRSILEDGYTMPIVTFDEGKVKEGAKIKIVDGFHRRQTERNNLDINASTMGRIPITDVRRDKYDISDRMASTIRHNRARGVHNIELMSEIVAELVEMGKGDRWICQHIGMSADELLRLKQITGLASLFLNKDFSASWLPEGEEVSFEFEETENSHEY